MVTLLVLKHPFTVFGGHSHPQQMLITQRDETLIESLVIHSGHLGVKSCIQPRTHALGSLVQLPQ